MSDKGDTGGIGQGLKNAVGRFTKSLSSRMAEAAVKRLIQAGLETGLDIIVSMLNDGIGTRKTLAILEDKVEQLKKPQTQADSGPTP